MSHSPGFPYLTFLVLLPFAGALAVALLGGVAKADRRLVEGLGIAVSVAVLGFSIGVAVLFHAHVAGYQLVSNHVWAQGVGVRWYLGVDGISLFLLLLTAVLFPIVLVGARTKQNATAYIAWMLVLEAACIGSFLSLDLILFFFFFELTLVPSYFIISGWGYARRAYAAVKFFIYTFLGSAFLLVGILVVAFLHQSQTGVLTFSLPALEHTALLQHDRHPAVLGVHRGVRGQGAALPAPHVVAGRLPGGADGRVDDPGRGAGEAGHVRHPPVRPQPLSPGRRRTWRRSSSPWRSSASSTARSWRAPSET